MSLRNTVSGVTWPNDLTKLSALDHFIAKLFVFFAMAGVAYPLVNIQKAMKNGPFIVDLAVKNGGSFHGFLCTFTRPGTTKTPS